MTAGIQRGRDLRVWVPGAVFAALALLAGCSGGSSGASAKLSVSGLRDKARTAAGGAASCPVRYDVDKAAAQAGVTDTVKPGPVSADLDETAAKGSALATSKGAVIECDYRLGGEPVAVQSVAVEHGRAVNLMGPHIDADAGMGIDALKTYLNKVAKTDIGTPVLTPSGNVASVGLPVDGTGDIALVVTFGDNQHTALTGHQVTVVTEELAKQAKW